MTTWEGESLSAGPVPTAKLEPELNRDNTSQPPGSVDQANLLSVGANLTGNKEVALG